MYNVLGFMNSIISSTSQEPANYSSVNYFSKMAIDGNWDTFQHTKEIPGEICWWKATFISTIHITRFVIVARVQEGIQFTGRINGIKVYTVLYKQDNAEKSEEHLLVETSSLATITTQSNPTKEFKVTAFKGVAADELLLKRIELMNFSEIYIYGY